VGRPASSAKERVRSKSSVTCPACPGEANISSKRKRRGGMLPRCRPSRQQLGSVAEVQSTSISEMLFCRLGRRQHDRITSGTEPHHRHRLVRCFEVDGVGALDEGANAIDPASVDDCVSNLPRVLAQQSTLSRGDAQQAYERRRSLESNAAYELLNTNGWWPPLSSITAIFPLPSPAEAFPRATLRTFTMAAQFRPVHS
jgi:hypothetical protein